MRARCTNPKAENYKDYGGRGIKIHGPWQECFWTYVCAVGLPDRPGWQLNRIHNNGNYEPGNVKWVSLAENNRNRRCTVLTASIAAEIRQRRIGGEKLRAIAEDLSLDMATVHGVISARTWNDGDAPDLRLRRRNPGSHRETRGTRHDLLTAHPVYEICCAIKARCNNPNNLSYRKYGAKGITLYASWADSMRAFVEGMIEEIGPRPSPMHSVDRIKNAKGYEPGNLRWATATEQVLNRRPRRKSE